MDFTIKGESGAGWGASTVAPEALGLDSGQLQGGTFDADGMTLGQKVGNMDLSTWPLPTKHQRVTLFCRGNVVFSGWVTKRRINMDNALSPQVAITVSGVHYWLRKIPVVSSTQHEGFEAAADRPEIVFPDGQLLGTSIANLLASYNAKFSVGDARRITVGTIASTYALPRLRLTGGNYLAALADLLKWCPDAVPWFSYAESGATFNLSRRGSMSAIDLPMGAATELKKAVFNERWDVEGSSGVSVDYCAIVDDQSAATGQTRYLSQVSTGATAGAVRVAVAGPEIDTFLPPTKPESEVVQSAALGWAIFRDQDPQISAIPGIADGGLGATLGTIEKVSDEAGKSLTGSHNYYLLKGSPKDWWSGVLPSFNPIRATCSVPVTLALYGVNLAQSETWPWGRHQVNSTPSASPTWTTTALTQEQWHFFQFAAVSVETVDVDPSEMDYAGAQLYTARYTAKASAVLVTSAQAETTIYRRPDYQYYQPPSGLAENLAAAQNWVPYEGSATLVKAVPLDTQYVGAKINVTNGPSDWATMNALVVGHSVDLFNGYETLTCGVPQRFAHVPLTDRILPSGKTNFAYL